MIYPLVHGSSSLVLTAALWLGNVVFVRVLLARAFGSRRFFAVATSSAFVLLLAHGAWALFHDHDVVGLAAMTICSAAPVFLALTLVSIPMSAVTVKLVEGVAERASRAVRAASPTAVGRQSFASSEGVAARERAKGEGLRAATTDAHAGAATGAAAGKRPAVSRRDVLAIAASVAPLTAIGAGVRGFSNGFESVKVVPRALTVPRLAPSLEGLRIAQLSDVHLGVYRQLPDLERALEVLAASRPDLVVLTGDFVEHGDLLADALRLVRDLAPPHGVYACLGNHEYFQRIRDVRTTYEKVGVPLLVDEAATVRIGTERLAILGVDDPRHMRGDIEGMLRGAIERSLRTASGDTKLLLSHRPEAIVPASALDVALVLSGHTHGGQIGFNGKSAFEAMNRDGYLWGAYQRETTRLYTTSGFGHWYPFRLGCASELPLLTLTRGTSDAPSVIARS